MKDQPKNKNVKLNNIQIAHQQNELNVYKPIKAYAEEWVHVEDKQ